MKPELVRTPYPFQFPIDPIGEPEPAEAPPAPALPPELPLDLTALERLAIEEALRRVNGNRTHAARLLGIGLRTLRNKLRAWREAGQPWRPPAGAAAAGAGDDA
jgi:two-component system response regulator FlrC